MVTARRVCALLRVERERVRGSRLGPAAVACVVGVLASAACGESDGGGDDPVAVSTAGSRPAAQQPAKPIRLAGTGPLEEVLSLQASGPVVVKGRSRGTGPFTVTVSATWGKARVFDTERPLDELAALPASTGVMSVSVQTRRSWSVTFEQRAPGGTERELSGSFSGRGSSVTPVRIGESRPRELRLLRGAPAVEGVWLFSYEPYAGAVLVDQPSPEQRRFAITEPLSGSYLLFVSSRGPWEIRFDVG